VTEGDVVSSHSPTPSSLLASSRSPPQSDNLFSYTSYIPPSYIWTSAGCDGCLPVLTKPMITNDSCFHPMINMSSPAYAQHAQQMMAQISGFANKSKLYSKP